MKLISITGPESTGKSSLAQALAGHYRTVWVKEYAREYLQGLGRKYVYKDIVEIAKGQFDREQQAAITTDGMLFCDTDLLVCKIWSLFKFGKVDPWIQNKAREHRYDLYLLCDIDLPWADDPMREHPQSRQELFDLYLHELKNMGARFEIVTGLGKDRSDNAISIIDRTFIHGNLKGKDE